MAELSQYETKVIAEAFSIMERLVSKNDFFTRPAASAEYLQLRLGAKEREVFSVMFLNTQHQLIACEDMFFGTIDGASIYPREVVKRALAHNAGAVIFGHNHPSGKTEPSSADIAITRRLKEALELVDVRVLDHIVVSASGWQSMANRGLI